MSREAYYVQRDFALASGLASQIVWDSIAPDQSHLLKQKIEIVIPDNYVPNRNEVEKLRQKIYNNVWTQTKYTNRTLLASIIFVLVADECDPTQAKYSTNFSCHPVFRTRKCLNEDNSLGCCMIFVDEFGRVYKNWSDYRNNNQLPKGIMIAPSNGVYMLNVNDEVLLEYDVTPAARPIKKIIRATDTVAGISGLTATLPLAAALVVPVTASVMAAASIVCLSTAAYSAVRSTVQLTDRGRHGQSLALTDREARGNWIGLASSAFGMTAIGATKAVTLAATTGQEISLGAKVVVSGVNASSILVSGTGVVNSVYDIYLKVNSNEEFCGQDILQLASALLIFTNSINNLNVTVKIMKNNVSNVPLRAQLVNNMRENFNRFTQEITNSQINGLRGGNTGRNFDMIRMANDIPLRDNLLNLHRANLDLQGNDISNTMQQIAHRLSYGLPFIIQQLRAGATDVDISQLARQLGEMFVGHIVDQRSLLEILSMMAKFLTESVFQYLLRLARTFIENFVAEIDRTIRTYISTELVLYEVLRSYLNKFSHLSNQQLEETSNEILISLDEYFRSLDPHSASGERVHCKVCKGYFVITEI